jgi:hypothetical protein
MQIPLAGRRGLKNWITYHRKDGISLSAKTVIFRVIK